MQWKSKTILCNVHSHRHPCRYFVRRVSFHLFRGLFLVQYQSTVLKFHSLRKFESHRDYRLSHNYPLALSECQFVRCANHNFCLFHENPNQNNLHVANRHMTKHIHSVVRSARSRMLARDRWRSKAGTTLQFSHHCPCARGYVTSKSNGIVYYYNKHIYSWILKFCRLNSNYRNNKSWIHNYGQKTNH